MSASKKRRHRILQIASLKALRLRHGIMQPEVAAEVRVSQSHYSNLEIGARPALPGELRLIHAAIMKIGSDEARAGRITAASREKANKKAEAARRKTAHRKATAKQKREQVRSLRAVMLSLGVLRQNTGIQQTEISRIVGIDHTLISRLESGDRPARPEQVAAIKAAITRLARERVERATAALADIESKIT